MADTVHITYLFDPLCGWCYGASGVIEKLAAQPDLALELAPTGLFAGDGARQMDDAFAAYAWANDERISRLTGQPFSQAYRSNVLGDRTSLLDSGPATLALTAVALTSPEQEFEALKAIQKARYVEGGDVTDIPALATALRGLELDQAADRLADLDDGLIAAYRERIESARQEMRRFGEGGVPTLIAGDGDGRRVVRSSALFGGFDLLLAELRA